MNVSLIRHHIKRYFSRREVDEIFEMLGEYTETPRPDFTYIALIRLSRGSKLRLREWIQRAKISRERILRAASNVESWEGVIESYASDIETHSPALRPLLLLARQILTSPLAEEFRAGRSLGRLTISEKDWSSSSVRIIVGLETPPSANARFQIESFEREKLVRSLVCDPSKAFHELESLLQHAE